MRTSNRVAAKETQVRQAQTIGQNVVDGNIGDKRVRQVQREQLIEAVGHRAHIPVVELAARRHVELRERAREDRVGEARERREVAALAHAQRVKSPVALDHRDDTPVGPVTVLGELENTN